MPEVDLDNLSTSDLLELGLECHIESAIDVLVSSSEKQASAVRSVVADLPTVIPVSVYWNPVLEKFGMYFPSRPDDEVFGLYKAAVAESTSLPVAERPLTRAHLSDWWVKVAHSPMVRGAGELLQFLPSETVPGFGGRPIASMVASGLLGAGLGYGGGWLAEKFIPERYKDKGRFARSMAMMGGLGGAALGSIPGLINLYTGKSFNDPSMFSGPSGTQLKNRPPIPYKFENTPADAPLPSVLPPDTPFNPLDEQHRLEMPHMPALGSKYLQAAASIAAQGAVEDPDGVCGDLVKAAMGTLADSPVDLIRTDELGRVLWGSDANPTTTMMTASALHGASQMYDPRALPGTVTPHQTGLLGLAMGAAGGGLQGYIVGYGVGKAMSALTGLPDEAQKFVAQTGLGLGVLNSVVPKLFGR